MENNKVKVDTIVALARVTVEEFVTSGKVYQYEDIDPACLKKYRGEKAGTFVTIYKDGNLRGCIGTIQPVHRDIIQEVIRNAVSSCSRDPRFPPVNASELSHLKYSVNVLMPPEPIESTDELDPQKYGVIVSSTGNRRGLLLPRIEGINSIQEQVFHAMAKGGIRRGDPIWLYRFESIEHKEE